MKGVAPFGGMALFERGGPFYRKCVNVGPSFKICYAQDTACSVSLTSCAYKMNYTQFLKHYVCLDNPMLPTIMLMD